MQLGAPHTESFSHMLQQGLKDCVANMVPIQFETAQKDQIKMFVDSITIEAPRNIYGKKIYPTECRQLKSTYGGTCNIRVGFSVNSGPIEYIETDMGEFPIMVQVNLLHAHSC